MRSSYFNAKIESLELNLKNLEDELITEKNIILASNEEGGVIVEGDNNGIIESDVNSINTIIDENEEVTKKTRSNSVRRVKSLTNVNYHIIIIRNHFITCLDTTAR